MLSQWFIVYPNIHSVIQDWPKNTFVVRYHGLLVYLSVINNYVGENFVHNCFYLRLRSLGTRESRQRFVLTIRLRRINCLKYSFIF